SWLWLAFFRAFFQRRRLMAKRQLLPSRPAKWRPREIMPPFACRQLTLNVLRAAVTGFRRLPSHWRRQIRLYGFIGCHLLLQQLPYACSRGGRCWRLAGHGLLYWPDCLPLLRALSELQRGSPRQMPSIWLASCWRWVLWLVSGRTVTAREMICSSSCSGRGSASASLRKGSLRLQWLCQQRPSYR